MISPPNHGSEVVDKMKDLKLFEKILGPAGQQLGTDSQSLPLNLKPINGIIGIITGTRSSDPWFSLFIEGEDDGKVSVESARLPEMTDFITVKHGHTFVMRQRKVINQILTFLQIGEFQHPD